MALALTSSKSSGLDAFIRREWNILLSILFVASTLHLAAQTIYSSPKRQLVEDLARVNAFLERENRKAVIAGRAAKPGSHEEIASPPAAPAASLTRLVSAAAAQEVEVAGVSPDAANAGEFKAAVSGDFREVVRFLARLERLHVMVKGLEIVPDTPGQGSRLRSTLAIELGDDTLRAMGVRQLEVPELSSLINPFVQRACTETVEREPAEDKADRDRMKLSAVTQMGDLSFATIDGLDYAVGDTVHGYNVMAIGPNTVRLLGNGTKAAGCLVLSLPVILSSAPPEAPPAP